tara:strand:+ start:426 stop:1103 length:678 start_codon:yes stop_codon:yes gene_type:complete
VRVPQVVILAGGMGTRLGEISKKKPKSLVEVDGKPILTRILDWANKQGCERGLILTGHLGEMFHSFSHEMDLIFVQEPEPLGTGGALWNAREYLENEFILLWGDDFHPINYESLISKHRIMNAEITMTVTEEHRCMNLKHQNGIVVEYDKTSPSDDYNGYEAGTSIVKKSVVEKFKKKGKWSWEETVYPALSGKIVAHIDNSKFWDIGTPKRLEILENFLKDGRT